ncbi:hypothetical protein I6B53_01510 [Schaalia sp. 19OD2882]|uniref:hypothetical protein n=1 Tax=Schaalia sp. 19OD2882 TaxID=2794089 RepID=UPI001C1F0120|nr:hypothetical protein [Schaalia sp. 19OD2882]QWW19836.1 hypothetical protein I6B53_01510 [Schaalia sp. 19OD2882]
MSSTEIYEERVREAQRIIAEIAVPHTTSAALNYDFIAASQSPSFGQRWGEEPAAVACRDRYAKSAMALFQETTALTRQLQSLQVTLGKILQNLQEADMTGEESAQMINDGMGAAESPDQRPKPPRDHPSSGPKVPGPR